MASILPLLWARAKGAAGLVRLVPFGSSTAAERSKERYRRVVLSVLAGLLSKGVVLVTGLVTVPLALRHLGAERYGLWMTLISSVGLLGFADLGMGNSLRNAIAEADGRDQRLRARTLISSAYVAAVAVAIALALPLVLLQRGLPWAAFFNIDSSRAQGEVGPVLAVLLGVFLVNIPLSLTSFISSGYQETFTGSLWQAAGSALGFGGLLLAIRADAPLPWLAFSVAAAPAVAHVGNAFALFGLQRPWLRPRLRYAKVESVQHLARQGSLFLVLQLTAAVVVMSDNLVVARVFGAERVAEYSVIARMFAVISLLQNILVGPFWPAYGEALARRDIPWVKRALGRTVLLSGLVTALPSLVLVGAAGQILDFWIGKGFAPSPSLLLGFTAWTMLSAMGSAVTLLLTSTVSVRVVAMQSVFLALGAVGLKIALAQAMGLPGAIWGNTLAYVLFMMGPWIVVLPRFFAGLGPPRSIRADGAGAPGGEDLSGCSR